MEIDITKFFEHCQQGAAMDYSASVAEIGNDAGPSTWRAACDDSEDYMILDDEDKRDSFRQHIADFGAWDEAEVAAWSDVELNALFLQLIAGDMREGDLDCEAPDWVEYEAASYAGQCAGNIFKAKDGTVYYQLNY